jgi:hypothetical protein
MKVSAWSTRIDDESYRYQLQFDDIEGKRIRNRILKEMVQSHDCAESGSGYTKNGNYILLFSKTFESQQDWIQWARALDYPLVEYNTKSKPKPIKLGTHYDPKRGRKRKV